MDDLTQVQPVDYYPLENVVRRPSGIAQFDYLYGPNNIMHTEGPNRGLFTGEVNYGVPYSFLSILGGKRGVGKTRLAIAIVKSFNSMGLPCLYYNGESQAGQFRQMCGRVDHDLFLAATGAEITLEQIVSDAYKYKPPIMVFDSIQVIRGLTGTKDEAHEIFKRLIDLKADPAAGNPHLFFISQMTKANEIAGLKFNEHMVDWVGRAMPNGIENQFNIVSDKNRAGPAPMMATFEHHADGVKGLFPKNLQTSAQPNSVKRETPRFIKVYREKGFLAGVREYFKETGDMAMKKLEDQNRQ